MTRISASDVRDRLDEIIFNHRLQPFDAVVAQSETGLTEAAELCERLGVPGIDPRVRRLLKDKWATRALTRGCSFHVPARQAKSREDVYEQLSISKRGVVVKPRFGTGSRDVHFIHDAGAVSRIDLNADDYIVEEYVSGREVSVETVSAGGQHLVVAITDKVTSSTFVELRHQVPWEGSPNDQQDLQRAVTLLLDRVGYQNGPAHTEFMLTSDGPKLIESHPRRGGDRIHVLVELVYGFDLERWWFAQLAGHELGLPTLPSPRGTAVVGFAAAEQAGTLVSISGEQAARRIEGVIEVEVRKKVGNAVRPPQQSEDRLAHAIAFAHQPLEAVSCVRRALSCIRFAIA